LSAHTLAAYRRDLTLYTHWLLQSAGKALDDSSESDLRAHAIAHHAGTKATSATGA